MVKAVIYIRVSTSRQDNSEDLQEKKCLAFCESQGYDVVDIIVDSDVSGSKKFWTRKGGCKIRKLIDSGKVNQVVALKLDRMFRSTSDGLITIDDFQKLDIGFSLIDMNLDTRTPSGRMILSVLLAFSEFERNTIRERITSVLRNKRENMEVYSGNPPFGLKKVGNKLKVHEKNMLKVAEVFELKNKGYSVNAISKELVLGYKRVSTVLNKEEFYSSFITT